MLEVAPAPPGGVGRVAVALRDPDGVHVRVVVALAVAPLHRRGSLGKSIFFVPLPLIFKSLHYPPQQTTSQEVFLANDGLPSSGLSKTNIATNLQMAAPYFREIPCRTWFAAPQHRFALEASFLSTELVFNQPLIELYKA